MPTTDLPARSVAVLPVSANLRQAKSDAQLLHFTVGAIAYADNGILTLACSCGMDLTNGPTWTLDEHIRLHRAEAKFLALSVAAPTGIPRLVATFELAERALNIDPVLLAA